MFKNKTIVIAILLCALIPLTAQATITRVIGLGGSNTNYIIRDAANPQIFPQLISNYGNLAGAEFYTGTDGWDFQKAYLNYYFSANKAALQVAVDKLPGIRSSFFGGSRYNEAPNMDNLGNAGKLNVTYGQPFGDMKVGATLTMAQQSMKTKDEPNETPPVTKRELSSMLIGINLGLTALEDNLDAAVGFETVSFSDKQGSVTAMESDGSMALNVAARYWYEYAANRAYLVPNFRFQTLKDAYKAPEGEKEAVTHTNIKLGVGHNWTPVDNMLAVFEVGVDMMNEEVETNAGGNPLPPTRTIKSSMSSLPYWRIGFETVVTPWLNGRLGAERNWMTMSSDYKPSGEPSYAYSETNTYLGATVHWNRMFLDLLVSPHFLRTGPQFIGGQPVDVVTQVSLKYDFNK